MPTYTPTEAEIEELAGKLNLLAALHPERRVYMARWLLERYELRSEGQRCKDGLLTLRDDTVHYCPGCPRCAPKVTPYSDDRICAECGWYGPMHSDGCKRSTAPEPTREVGQRELDAFNRGYQSAGDATKRAREAIELAEMAKAQYEKLAEMQTTPAAREPVGETAALSPPYLTPETEQEMFPGSARIAKEMLARDREPVGEKRCPMCDWTGGIHGFGCPEGTGVYKVKDVPEVRLHPDDLRALGEKFDDTLNNGTLANIARSLERIAAELEHKR